MKKLNVDGYIVNSDDKWIYDLFGITAITLKEVREFLKTANGEEVELFIDCFGGDVWTASDMYSELRAYKGKSTANIIGLSASASTVMMLGCEKVVASPTAQIMVHNSQTVAQGDYRDMEHAATVLKNVNDTIINAYEIKTGMNRDELAAIMDNETWMTAQQALKYGFIDEISLKKGESLSDLQISAVLSMSGRAYAVASIDTFKMHEFAQRFKQTDEPDKLKQEPQLTASIEGGFLIPEAEEKPNDSGDESRPVSDKLKNQKAEFHNIRKKLLEVN